MIAKGKSQIKIDGDSFGVAISFRITASSLVRVVDSVSVAVRRPRCWRMGSVPSM